jgi:uncharacterized cupin superfamily protein
MYVPPGGGPPPHRHDLDETFILLGGELVASFRGEIRIVRRGVSVGLLPNVEAKRQHLTDIQPGGHRRERLLRCERHSLE